MTANKENEPSDEFIVDALEKMASAEAIAITAIAESHLLKFETALQWAQWCRDISRAATVCDMELVIKLATESQLPEGTEF